MEKWKDVRKKILSDQKVFMEYNRLPSIDIAAQIINARSKKGLTQLKLAKLVKTSQSAIARLENGHYAGYSLKTLSKIAKALNFNLKITFMPRSKAS
ncbi:MAG: helix-turn-helix transcriptional regulator [Armatimonadetes bacterium]|nr:helix-turn-helix transcriptional regulator [Armatimonadota bacterium]